MIRLLNLVGEHSNSKLEVAEMCEYHALEHFNHDLYKHIMLFMKDPYYREYGYRETRVYIDDILMYSFHRFVDRIYIQDIHSVSSNLYIKLFER